MEGGRESGVGREWVFVGEKQKDRTTERQKKKRRERREKENGKKVSYQ